MDGMDLVPLELAGILKGKFGDAGGSLYGDYLQRLHHPRHYFMFQPYVLTLGVLAHDDQVYAGVASVHPRQVLDGAEVGE
jgi:hypothetical protein